MIFFSRLVRNGDDDFAGRLLIMPAGFESRQEQAHLQHQSAFEGVNTAQAIPSAGGSDAKRARQVCRNQHMWKSDPYDRAKDNCLPFVWNEDAVLDCVTH